MHDSISHALTDPKLSRFLAILMTDGKVGILERLDGQCLRRRSAIGQRNSNKR